MKTREQRVEIACEALAIHEFGSEDRYRWYLTEVAPSINETREIVLSRRLEAATAVVDALDAERERDIAEAKTVVLQWLVDALRSDVQQGTDTQRHDDSWIQGAEAAIRRIETCIDVMREQPSFPLNTLVTTTEVTP